MTGPGAATIKIAAAISSKSLRKCTLLLSATIFIAAGSAPACKNMERSIACAGFDETAARTPPVSSSAIGPRSMSAPASIGPVAGKLPSERCSTRKRAANGSLPGKPDLPPSAMSICAPAPAACARSAACGSLIKPTSASGARRATSARRISVVSHGPPPPGLSWVSASSTGPFLRALFSSRSASSMPSSMPCTAPRNSALRRRTSLMTPSAAASTALRSKPCAHTAGGASATSECGNPHAMESPDTEPACAPRNS